MDVEEFEFEETYYECAMRERGRDSAGNGPGEDGRRSDRLRGEEGRMPEDGPHPDESARRCDAGEERVARRDDGWDEYAEYEDRADEDFAYQARHMHNRDLGRRGESAAARYLELKGYEILERNWTCPAGEADIIAFDGDELVFIEVKTRTGISRGFPEEAVDAAKRARYEKIAAWYLRGCSYSDISVRFDVISLLVISHDRAFMKHYVNAFGLES